MKTLAKVWALLCALPFVASAQFTGFSFEVDTVFSSGLGASDTYSVLAGYQVTHVYANFTHETDVFSSLYADVGAIGTPPMGIEAPCGCFDYLSGNPVIDSLNSVNFYQYYPPAQYDSFYTVGMTSALDEGTMPFSVGIESSDFCSGFVIEDGAVFVSGMPSNAIAGPDLKVLVAQVTTCGEFDFQACVQTFVEGNTSNAYTHQACASLHVPMESPFGCMDPLACNYSNLATESDGSCDYSCCPGPGCCHYGTVWSLELQKCVVENPSDINLDGCVQLNDLLELLLTYGNCGE